MIFDPEPEVVVGGAGKVAMAFHKLFPEGVEKAMAAHTHRTMVYNSPPAGSTSGAVHHPSKDGRVVAGRQQA